MRLTPSFLMTALRRGAVVGAVVAVGLLLAPLHYKDLGLPFPDTVAHSLMFYGLAVLAFGALPRTRVADVALSVVAVGAISEVVQSLVGREMSWHDLGGDSLGVAVAYVPVAVMRLRELARQHPDLTFAEIRRLDRRRGRPLAVAAPIEAPTEA